MECHTNTKLPTDFIEITKPMLRRVSFKVAEEAKNDGTTNEQYLYEDQNYTKTTITKLSMDFLEIPQPSFTRKFFLKLAEEARNGGVDSGQWFLVDEVLPQVTGMTKSVIEPMSWLLQEELEQFVEVTWEALSRVAPMKYEIYEAGHMMQQPDIKSDGVMIDGFMLESKMSPVGSVRGAAEPVLLAAKSEVFTPVVFAGGVVAAAAPLAVVEAVTARVSVLPVVGSELSISLSATVGVMGQLVVDLGDTLDKVGHGAGQSCVCVFK